MRAADEHSPPTRYTPRALFAISSLGLGHATRTLAVIRAYLERGYRITIVSAGAALAFLRLELEAEAGVDFREMPDYPPLERGSGWRLYVYLLADLLDTWRCIRREHRALLRIESDYDFVFSDGRYGFHGRWTPSFILSHQISFIPPRALRDTAWLTEHVNVAALRRFDCLLIPDCPGCEHSLAGALSHSARLGRCTHRHVGILSSYRALGLARYIDYLFVISGYLLEHKDTFVRTLLEQSARLPGRKVFVLGAPDADGARYQRFGREDLEIHTVASGMLRQELFDRACRVVSRAGYTTVMDLVEHGKRAVLIPTPNQTEQEYLAQYLSGRRWFAAGEQSPGFDLVAALADCERTLGFEPPWRTHESVRRIVETIEGSVQRRFFTIVVPAHDEEKEIAATLQCLLAQHYRTDRYEIVVVENGSTDATLAIALAIAAHPKARGRLHVLRSERGVSRARNVGLMAASDRSGWTVLCDADTHLGPHFLQQLDTWIERHGCGASIGTTAIRPRGGAGAYGCAWFRFYDLLHRLTRTSFAIQFAPTAIARAVRYDERLDLAEDLRFIRDCRRHGRFVFVPSDQVSTSVRRFEAHGYLRQGLRWAFDALLPLRLKRQRRYEAVR